MRRHPRRARSPQRPPAALGAPGTGSSLPGGSVPRLLPVLFSCGVRERGAAPRRTAFPRDLRDATQASPEIALTPGLLGRVVLVPPQAFAPTTCPVFLRPEIGGGSGRSDTRARRLSGTVVPPCAENAGNYNSRLFRGGGIRGSRARHDGYRSSQCRASAVLLDEAPES